MRSNYYVAKIFARKALVDIRINDVPLIKLDIEDDFSAEIPINYLIESTGSYTLMMWILPNIGSNQQSREAECCIDILSYDATEEFLTEVEQVCSLQSSLRNQEIKFPNIQTIKFHAEVSYHMCRWSDCEIIKKDASISSKIARYYQQIWNLLSEKKYAEYLNLIGARERCICKSLMIDEQNVKTRNELFFDCVENGFELCPMKGKKTLEFYANHRVVSVLDADLRPAIRFKNNESGEILTLDILLGIKKGQQDFCIV